MVSNWRSYVVDVVGAGIRAWIAAVGDAAWEVWSESTVAGIIILPRYVNQCVAAMLRDRKRCTIDLPAVIDYSSIISPVRTCVYRGNCTIIREHNHWSW